MPPDLDRLLAPGQSALVVLECQRGVVGDLSGLPGLAEQAQKGMIPVVAELVRTARSVGVPVIHGTALRRRDGLGANRNARLFRHMEKVEHPLYPESEAAEIVPEIPVAESDLVLPRLHGLSPFQGTELDSILRNLGIGTVIGVGVSVNVAVQNFAFDAVNAAYQVVIPRDGVAGFPESYKEAVFEHTLAAITTLVQSDAILAAWRRAGPEPAGSR
ncbi:MAG TPA: cysteine hydrolase [Deltaproteobacteria bacterium]|nr:cysteine hydrolase [Deltaproteobacteria bacterium]